MHPLEAAAKLRSRLFYYLFSLNNRFLNKKYLQHPEFLELCSDLQ